MVSQLKTESPSGVTGLGPQYLFTIEGLEKNAVAKFGMDEDTYEEFAAKMLKVAKEKGIVRPIMGIGIKERAYSFLKVIVYPITKEEWAKFKKDADKPKVYVIDGSKIMCSI